MDFDSTIAVKDIISVTSPLIKSLVDTFVTPKLAKLSSKWYSKDSYIPTDTDFTEYYHRTFKRLVVVNTLVFRNSQRLLPDIYTPLTINNGKIKSKIEKFPNEILKEFQNILITDTAGMGKSTLMKKIFIEAIKDNTGIPVFIELRRLSRDKKLIDEIQEQLSSLGKKFKSDLLLELLIDGEFIIILDGYDEIALNERGFITSDIQEFMSKASNNYYIITSRPENALASFGEFQEFRIEPLMEKEAFDLLRRYDNKGKISSLLIKKIKEDDMVNIHEFLSNPLLVSLLFTAFEHKQSIPFKKYLFYRQVYDANFETHDLTKGDSYIHDKYSKLEIDDFHRVLRHIGFSCLKNQKIEYTKDEILKLIAGSKNFCAGLVFNESDFLSDILKTVPLFSQDGNYYKWSHKSLQEYFAAQFIYLDTKEKQNSILESFYNYPDVGKFYNILDLYYDMDYKTFRNVIEYKLLLEYHNHDVSLYNEDYMGVSNEDVEERKELTFLMNDISLFRPSDKGFNSEEMKNKYRIMYSGVIADDVGYLFISNPNSKIPLLNLLLSKKNIIVKNNNITSTEDSYSNLSSMFSYDYEFIKLDDSPRNMFNSQDSFKQVNSLLKSSIENRNTFDHKKALIRLSEIKENIESEVKDDFLSFS